MKRLSKDGNPAETSTLNFARRVFLHLFVLMGLTVFALGMPGRAQAQATCDSSLWQVIAPDNTTNSGLYSINTATNPFTYNLVGTATVNYNGGDFNPVDGYIYAIRSTSGQLVKINPLNGQIVSGPTTVSGLGGGSLAGSFTATLDNMFYVYRLGVLYRIDVTSATPTAVPVLTVSGSPNITDFAYVNGFFYYVFNDNLYRISPTATGTVTPTLIGPTGVSATIGALFGAPNGLFGASNTGGFYQYDLTTGAATLISSSPTASFNDGFHCPTANLAFGADIGVTKTNTFASGVNDLTTDTYAPGETRTYTIVVSNAGPFGGQNLGLMDTLPTGIASATWTCTGTNGGVCGAASGSTSTGTLNLSGIDLPYSSSTGGGSVTIQVTLTVPTTYTGNLVNNTAVVIPNTVIDNNSLNNTAADTDPSRPTIKVAKQSVGGVGVFNYTLGGLSNTSAAITTVTSGTTVTSPQLNVGTAGTAATITETVVAGYTTTSSCSDSTGGQTAINGGTTAITIPSTSMVNNSTWTCTFVNTKQPIVRLQKSLPGGRFNTSDQFTLSIVGAGAPAPVTTSGSGSTATGTVTMNPATIGSAYALSETAAAGANLANYITTYNCTNALAGGQTSSGSGISFSVTPVAGDDITCTLVNTARPKADLTITKTNTPGVNGNLDQTADTLKSGTTTTYTIIATNNGPASANGSVVSDTPLGGLSNCATSSATASGGAVAPASPGGLLTGGVAIPTLPAGGSVTFTVTCSVN